jgi:hypothetical protein
LQVLHEVSVPSAPRFFGWRRCKRSAKIRQDLGGKL